MCKLLNYAVNHFINISSISAKLSFLAGCLLLISVDAAATDWQPRQLLEFTTPSCRSWEETGQLPVDSSIGPVKQSKIEVRGLQIGTRQRISVDQQTYLVLDVINPGDRPAHFISTLYGHNEKPLIQLVMVSDCSLRSARKIIYSDAGQALKIDSLDQDLIPSGEPVWLNPPLVLLTDNQENDLTRQNDLAGLPIRVGMVDSGVNYLLPEINRQLARDENDRLIGYDFWDMDDLPYDSHPQRDGFLIQHHGTRTASLLLAEAPGIELVAYRYPRPDMRRMKLLVEHANRHGVTILGLPLGSNHLEDWEAFAIAAQANAHMLFIVSAGNNGRDIDKQPVYPAVLALDNILVVTSANDYVRPAERTNWGRKSVDYMIPAEQVVLTDFTGKPVKASGSSYAVARLTALAARLKMAHRDWNAADILVEIRNRFVVKNINTSQWVSTGYIADPLVGKPVYIKPLPDLHVGRSKSVASFQLDLDILVLETQWSRERIEQAVQTASDLLEQCGIFAGEVSVRAIDGANYLRDLTTGGAHTLFEVVETTGLRVVFARDTRMQEAFDAEAFGAGNTRQRPWLRYSVWLTLDIEDDGIALAHEIFHVLANNGAHVEGKANLMQSRTQAQSLSLTAEQCAQAQVFGLSKRLLKTARN